MGYSEMEISNIIKSHAIVLFKRFKRVCSFYHFVPFYVAFRYLFSGENVAAAFAHKVLDVNVHGTFLCLSIYVYFTIYDNLKATRPFFNPF